MPLCSRCQRVKPALGFYTYLTPAGRVMLKNPCVDCAKRITRISKTRRARLTRRRGSK